MYESTYVCVCIYVCMYVRMYLYVDPSSDTCTIIPTYLPTTHRLFPSNTEGLGDGDSLVLLLLSCLAVSILLAYPNPYFSIYHLLGMEGEGGVRHRVLPPGQVGR